MLPGLLTPWGRKKTRTQKTGVINIQAHLAWSPVSGTGHNGKLPPSVGLSIILCNLISPGSSIMVHREYQLPIFSTDLCFYRPITLSFSPSSALNLKHTQSLQHPQLSCETIQTIHFSSKQCLCNPHCLFLPSQPIPGWLFGSKSHGKHSPGTTDLYFL